MRRTRARRKRLTKGSLRVSISSVTTVVVVATGLGVVLVVTAVLVITAIVATVLVIAAIVTTVVATVAELVGLGKGI